MDKQKTKNNNNNKKSNQYNLNNDSDTLCAFGSCSNFIAKNADALLNSLPSHIFTESCFYGIFITAIFILTAINPFQKLYIPNLGS